MTLMEDSVQVILEHQAKSGAYVASPAFAHYQYAWLRDGTFTAYAMNRVGKHESARAFYKWCDYVISRHAKKARAAITAVKTREKGDKAGNDRFLHTRYTVEGEEVLGEWGSFQLDGYGTWLWGLAEHVRQSGEQEMIQELKPSIELTIDYVAACWQLPNFDCWEEGGDRIHPVTLGAIYAGIKAMEPYLPDRAAELAKLGEDIRQFILAYGTAEGRLIKSIGDHAVDASLLWMALPYGVFTENDPLMIRTVQVIEEELRTGYGVHRYPADTYYGGGQWLLLSAWLGWYYAKTDRREEAEQIAVWIASWRQPDGLPEQVQGHLLSPPHYTSWVERAGHPAVPLLWSHAMYIVLAVELGQTIEQ